jgi:YegS/Rv2252/BmrU family lipid kinase
MSCMLAPSTRPKQALLLLNHRAGPGNAQAAELVDLLAAGGIHVTAPDLRDRASVSAAIRAHAGEVDLVVVGGGDGTVNAAAAGIMETGLPLGILPLGTANDLARTLRLPTDPAAAAQVILDGHIREIDLGEVNGHFYFNVASIGFSARLARRLTRDAKQRWGVLGYSVVGAKLFSEGRPFTVHIEHDGTIETVRTVQVSVGNGRYYGGGLQVDATAQPDDGLLHVYSLEVPHVGYVLPMLPALRRGTHGAWKRVRAFESTELTLRTRRRHEVNADGELVTTTPAHFRVHAEAVRVFVPMQPG